MYEELVTALRQMQDWDAMDFDDETGYAIEIIGEAANAIEGLEEKCMTYAETLQAYENPWIPVKDRLPEERCKVIVSIKHKIRNENTVDVGVREYRRWFHTDGFEIWNNYEVTHWMPLPTPPKEKNEE